MVVSGRVTDRIDGSAVSGSKVTFKGLSGSTTGMIAEASVVDGNYRLGDLAAADYEVTISGPSHVEHKTLRYTLSGSQSNFSVLEWNSCRFGACYDARFQEFFDWIARGREIGRNAIWKWKPPPAELYVDQEAVASLLSPAARDRLLSILGEVNNESVPEMYCGKVGALPITFGPPPAGRCKDGAVLVTLHNEDGPSFGGPCSRTGAAITGGVVAYRAKSQNDLSMRRDELTMTVAHELFHAAFASHAYGHGFGTGLMDGSNRVTRLSPQDRLAACIVYDDDTHPGNVAPDTNP